MKATLRDALRGACLAEGVEFRDVPADGRWHAADLADDPRGRGDGRIRLFPDGRGGQVRNWKGSDKPLTFFLDDPRPPSFTERLKREWEAQRRAEYAARERARAQAATARRVAALREASTPARDDHPYLEGKGVSALGTGLREAPLEAVVRAIGYRPSAKDRPLAGRILIAEIAAGGETLSVEFIDGAGLKTALAGGTKAGGYWPTQPLPEGDGAGLILLVAEGVATALSAAAATGHPAVAALSAGNLARVAQELRQRYPHATVAVLADLGNGQAQAERAARESGAALAAPEFTEAQVRAFEAAHGKTPTDFNDLAGLAGADAVRAQVHAALAAPPEPAPPGEAPAVPRRERIFELKRAVFDAVRDRGPYLDREGLAERFAQATGLSRAFVARIVEETVADLRERRFAQPFGLRAAALAAGADYVRVDARHLPPLPDGEGVYLVRSPMGSGKTHALAGLGGDLLYVAHLQSLVGDAARRLDLDDYRDAGPGRDPAPTGRLATCVNSIWKLAGGAPFGTLVVDESNQLAQRLAGLVAGETCKPTLVHQELARQAAGAGRAYYLDAQADALSLYLAQRLHPDRKLTVIDNAWRPPAGEARRVALAANHAGLAGAFMAAVAERAAGTGARAMLFTDSEREAQGLALHIAALHPGLRVLTVTGRTTGDPAVRAALADLDGRIGGYDVVLASPSLTTGVSIESTPFRVYGSYRHGHLATQDALQALHRVRHPLETTVFVRRGPPPDGVDGAAVVDERRRRAAMAGADLPDDGGLRAGLFKAAHDHAARSAMSRELFLWHAEDLGWRVEFAAAGDGAGRDALAAARALEDRRYRDRVLAAPALAPDQYEGLVRKLERTEAEAFALERHELGDFYRTTLDEALFGLDRRGRGRSAIALLEKLAADPAALTALDRRQAAAPGFCPERWKSNAAQAELLALAFRAVGLPERTDPRTATLAGGRLWLDGAPAPEWSAGTLDAAALAEIRARRTEFKAHLGLAVPADFEAAPLKFLNRILASKAGLRLTGRRTHARVRWYGLDPEATVALGRAMAHRREALRAAGAWPWPDGGPPPAAPLPMEGLPPPGSGAGAQSPAGPPPPPPYWAESHVGRSRTGGSGAAGGPGP